MRFIRVFQQLASLLLVFVHCSTAKDDSSVPNNKNRESSIVEAEIYSNGGMMSPANKLPYQTSAFKFPRKLPKSVKSSKTQPGEHPSQ